MRTRLMFLNMFKFNILCNYIYFLLKVNGLYLHRLSHIDLKKKLKNLKLSIHRFRFRQPVIATQYIITFKFQMHLNYTCNLTMVLNNQYQPREMQ